MNTLENSKTLYSEMWGLLGYTLAIYVCSNDEENIWFSTENSFCETRKPALCYLVYYIMNHFPLSGDYKGLHYIFNSGLKTLIVGSS